MPDEEHLGGFSQMGFHVIFVLKWLIDAVHVDVNGFYLLSVAIVEFMVPYC